MKQKIKDYQYKIKTTGFCVVNTLDDLEALKKALDYKPKFKLNSVVFQPRENDE